jgi:small conductance mechanosensitive channel
MVTNYMRDFAYFVCDMGVAYREDTEEVRQAMLDAFDQLAEDKEIAASLLDNMEWMGVMSFGDNAVVVRTRLKTLPGKQWAIGRAYNAIVKKVFDERGIEMPFPHRTIYFGEDKNGESPKANVAVAMSTPTK